MIKTASLFKVIAPTGPQQSIGDLTNSGLVSHGDSAVGVASVANCEEEFSAGWCASCKVIIKCNKLQFRGLA